MKKIYSIFIILITSNAFGYINQNIAGQCGVVSKLSAAFTINTHTCASGYFLPANVDGCRPCPAGYICRGGTFVFNPTKVQGITTSASSITQNISNACASNIPHYLFAVFEPNTVSLTWDDNNGHTTQSTCTYDGLINLPPTPTRTGYVFNGWTVKTNN